MEIHKFSDIALSDPFFDSLKADYKEFGKWYEKKSADGARAYIQKSEEGLLQAFLYLKVEQEALTDIEPPMSAASRLKVGTFKIDAHNTKLGEHFIKKIMQAAIYKNVDEIYVTIFPKHEALIKLMQRYGFEERGKKGNELVLIRQMKLCSGDVLKDYPFVHAGGGRKYLLSIRPEFHTQLFPDSILDTEQRDKDYLVRDVAHTNSIHKIYVCKMKGVEQLRRGDVLVIYRTNDGAGSAYYRSVASSICVVEEIKKKSDFADITEYLKYANAYSVFSEKELEKLYQQPNTVVIKMTYNAAFDLRIIRKELIEKVGLSSNEYWGFLRLTDEQFNNITSISKVNESLIIN